MTKPVSGAGSIIWMFVFLLSTAVLGEDASSQQIKERKLDGIFHLSKRNCADGKSRNCYFYVELKRAAARRLYDNMRVKARKDACTEGTKKTDGSGLHCFRSGSGSYGCYFGLDLVRQKIVSGDFSC